MFKMESIENGCYIILILTGFYFPKVTAPGASPPDLIWPLDDASYSTEVLISPTSPVDQSHCSMVFSTPPIGTPNQVLELSGSYIIDIDVSYPDIGNSDFSFAARFKTTDNNGVIFHYKPTSGVGPFLGLMIYLEVGKLKVTRFKTTVPTSETSTTVTPSVVLNTWNAVNVGLDVSMGKLLVGLNGNLEIDENLSGGIDFILPGVLRIGGTFDVSQPNFKGQIACAAFWDDEKDPTVSDATDVCEASGWTANTPTCTSSSPAVDRNDTVSGYFSAQTGIYPSTLNLMSTIQPCTLLKCAFECLRLEWCWYYQYDDSVSCGNCMLYDSSVTSWRVTGDVSNGVYKWRI